MALDLSSVEFPANSNKGDTQDFLDQLAVKIETYVTGVAFNGELPQGLALSQDPENPGLFFLS